VLGDVLWLTASDFKATHRYAKPPSRERSRAVVLCWVSLVRHIVTGHITTMNLVEAMQLMASGSMDKTICLWDVSGVCLHVLSHHTGYVSSVLAIEGFTKHQATPSPPVAPPSPTRLAECGYRKHCSLRCEYRSV
jgi:WD40 repeat protein